MRSNESMTDFARKMYDLLKSDRDVVIGVSGFTGEGKSTFTSQLAKEYSKIANTYWGFDRMTWQRKEMMNWIDGEGKERKGQLPEYSIIVPDELFAMFYSRQWFESEQIDAITTFNMCRDRHLLVIGNVPKFWSLDGGFLDRVRFYVYIPKRGVAWVFEQENNPWSKEPWNVSENIKRYRKSKVPESSPNFICELHYKDWDEKEKEEYYSIRNTKRVVALDKIKDDRVEKYRKIKKQRDSLIRWIGESLLEVKNGKYMHPEGNEIAEVVQCSEELVVCVLNGTK